MTQLQVPPPPPPPVELSTTNSRSRSMAAASLSGPSETATLPECPAPGFLLSTEEKICIRLVRQSVLNTENEAAELKWHIEIHIFSEWSSAWKPNKSSIPVQPVQCAGPAVSSLGLFWTVRISWELYLQAVMRAVPVLPVWICPPPSSSL